MSIVHFYPDADPETSSVDSEVGQSYALGSGVAWSTIVAASGSSGGDSTTTALWALYYKGDNVNNKFIWLLRGVMLFDTSSIPDTATILSAKLTIYGFAKEDDLSCTPDLNIYSVAPATNTETVAGDYDSFGTTAFCDTPITYANFNILSFVAKNDGINEFVLNATGLAAISKTGVTKIGLRSPTYDVGGSTPNWVSEAVTYISIRTADYGSYAPTLEVEYTIATKSLQRVTALTHILDYTKKNTVYSLRVYMGGLVSGDEGDIYTGQESGVPETPSPTIPTGESLVSNKGKKGKVWREGTFTEGDTKAAYKGLFNPDAPIPGDY